MTDLQIQAWLEQEDAHVAQTIRRYGTYVQYVPGAGEAPSFAYTVGLFGLGHPELLVFSMAPPDAIGVLNHLSERIRGGVNLVPGELLTFPDRPHRIVLEEVPNPGEIAFAANRHYQRPPEASVPLLQLTYDDLAGRFPWDDGYANPPHLQPRPGTFRA